MTSLRELQRSFGQALRAPAGASCDLRLRPAANLDVYRNNSDWQFRQALGASFPVVRRRVGEEFFRQLAFEYRRAFPSRSGDLHWVGRDFAEFLAHHLAGGDYAWLAHLARLEWSREEAAIARSHAPLDAQALAPFAAEELEGLTFTLQPSLRVGESPFPVVSVWLANHQAEGPPVDQSIGSEAYVVHQRDCATIVQRVRPSLARGLALLAEGRSLGAAVTGAGLDEPGVLEALRFLFAEGLVCAVQSAKR